LVETKNKLPLSDLVSEEDKMEASMLIRAFDLANANKIK